MKDIVVWAVDAEELLSRLEEIFARLVEQGLFVAAHKAMFFRDEIKWCGRLYSGEATIPDPDRFQGQVELRQPETAGELMRFVHAVNWSRPALPELATLEAPLRVMLEGCLQRTKRTWRAAHRRRLTAGEWTEEREGGWKRVRERVAQAVSLFHRKGGYQVLAFTGASDMHWRGCVTQVPMAQFVEGVAVAD